MDSILLSVILGCAAIGFCAGLVGCVVSLRSRNLEADVIAHCTMPGLVLGTICTQLLGFDIGLTRQLIVIAFGVAGSALATLGLARFSHLAQKNFGISSDNIQACILGLGFGMSLILLSAAQSYLPIANTGLRRLLLGNAATLTKNDVLLCWALAALLIMVIWSAKHQLAAYLFDPQAWTLKVGKSWLFEACYSSILFLVMIVGMRIVGIVLVVALLTIPWLTVKLWVTESFWPQCFASAVVGSLMAGLGVLVSVFALGSATNGLPTGPTIVVVAAAFCALSIAAHSLGKTLLRQRNVWV